MNFAVYNPQNKPLEQLPVIYGFNNGGSPGFMYASLIAEDGTGMGSHLCSSEVYMPGDLGCLEGTRPDRHEGFREHYPEGYRMEFVGGNPRKHAGIMAAVAKAEARAKADKAGVTPTHGGRPCGYFDCPGCEHCKAVKP